MWKKGRETIAPTRSRKRIFPPHDNPLGGGFFVVTHPHAGNFRRPATAMNPRTSFRKPRTAAFTLIELLTVIAIIAILMKLLFPVVIAAKNNARRAEATADAKQIVAACKLYFNDNGKFPPVSSSSATTVYTFGPKTKNTGVKGEQGDYENENADLFNVLRSIATGSNANNKLNPRQQKYFEHPVAKDTKNPRSGFVDGTGFPAFAPRGALMDPWGTQYCIMLDATGADEIAAKDVQKYYSDFETIRMGAMVFSLGKDQILGTKTFPKRFRGTSASDTPDDAISWE